MENFHGSHMYIILNAKHKQDTHFFYVQTHLVISPTRISWSYNIKIQGVCRCKTLKSFLLVNEMTVMKTFIHNTKIFLDQNDKLYNQSKWDFLKYETRKRSIAFSKALAKESKKEHALLLSKITKLEQDNDSEEKFDECEKTKNELEKIYRNITDSVKIRSKCSWY